MPQDARLRRGWRREQSVGLGVALQVVAVGLPELAKVYDANSLVPTTSTAEQVLPMIEKEIELWTPIIRSLGIKPE